MSFRQILQKPIFLFTVLILIIFAYYYRIANYGINRTVNWYWDLTNINFIITWFWLIFPIVYGLLALFRLKTNGLLSLIHLISIGIIFILDFVLGIDERLLFVIHIIAIIVFFMNVSSTIRNRKRKLDEKAST